LTLLTDLRKAAGLNLSDMAWACGLCGNQSHQTAGAWELGRMTPTARRRAPFLRYLWDTLRLRQQPAQLETLWETLVEEWDWEPISDGEWRALTHQPRPAPATPAEHSPFTIYHSQFTAPFQAPALTPHFVGRTAEVSQVEALLTTPAGPRMVALVGMGGIGKTTLATSLAHTLRTHFADGVLWARVATAHPLDILQSWAQAYGYDFSGLSDVESRAAALRNLLAQKQALLVLDDVRSASAAQVLLPNTASCAVLITTRSQEVAAALHATQLTLNELSMDAALTLLTSLLGPARVAAELIAAEAIGAALYYLPLALEIAAQRLAARPQQPLASLLQHLQDASARLHHLTVSDRAVRAAFLVSWQQMTPELQRIFALLGVFGGRSLPVAALAAVADLPPDAAQDHLWSLQALSLVKAEGNGRYRQHPLLADFARERLGEDAPATTRLADYYLHFARQQQTDHARLEPEWENLMAAMEGAYTRQQWQMVLDYAEALTQPWFAQARYTQARQGYGWAVEGAKRLENRQKLARIMIWQGYACSEQGDIHEAQQLLREGMALAQDVGDDETVSDAQYHLSRFALDKGEYEAADEFLTACANLRQTLGNIRGFAAVQCQQADLYYRHQQYAKAEELGQAALCLQEQEQDIREMLNTLRLLGDVANKKEDYTQATQYAVRALTLARQHNLHGEVAIAYFSLAVIARWQKQYHQTIQYCEQAQPIFQQLGNRAFLAATLYEASVSLKLMEKLESALEKGETALVIMGALQDDYNRVCGLFHVGDIYALLSKQEKANLLWEEGYVLAKRLRHPFLPRYEQVLNRFSTDI
jgi:tetratricopeptide (TPR) repeat protein/transcriptional regulator with XRE-family HTH domain